MLKYHKLDFILNKFRQLCSSREEKYNSITMDEYLNAGGNLPKRFVLMRHDIDRSAKNALKIARIEEEFDIRATYYFRTTKKTFVRNLCKYYDLRDFGLTGETYLSVSNNLNYFTDTGGSWNSKNNLRDHIPGKTGYISAETPDDHIELIESNQINNFYITPHPNQWKIKHFQLEYMGLQGHVMNSGKKVLMAVRR